MKDSVIAELKVVPLGYSDRQPPVNTSPPSSMSSGRQKAITYQITPMGTVVQDRCRQSWRWPRKCTKSPLKWGQTGSRTTISIDDRRDKLITMESKVKAVSK